MFATSISGGRRHLVNAYEVKAGMVFIADKTVYPCLSALKCLYTLYKYSAFTLTLYGTQKIYECSPDITSFAARMAQDGVCWNRTRYWHDLGLTPGSGCVK